MSDTATIEKKVSIEETGPASKRLKIEIPAKVVSEKLAESLDSLALEAELPGFRKGRAPKRLVERRFGQAVRKEAMNQIIATAYSEAIEEQKLKVLTQPTSSDLKDLVFEDGKPMSFTMELEVMPEFALPELKGIKVKRPDAKLPDGLVNDEIKKVCINEGDLEPRDAPEAGDYVTGVGRMVDEAGTEHYNINGAVVRVPTKEDEGKGMILGVMVEDFAKQFGLPKPGETATVTVTGPENHEVEALRGKKLTISFAVSRFGFESEAQLREAVEQRLSQRAQVVQKSVQHQQIARHLLKETKLDLPPKLTASQAARNLDRRRLELMYRGVDPAAIETHMAELRAASGEQAARDLKLVFILNKAAEELGVEVTEGEVNGRIVAMAMQRNARPDQLRAELIRTGQAGMVVQQVREHKTLDRILQDAEVTEMSVEEFNKAMRDEAGAA